MKLWAIFDFCVFKVCTTKKHVHIQKFANNYDDYNNNLSKIIIFLIIKGSIYH